MKSVNHRYLDVSIKMPKKLNFFEASIRSVLKEYIQRGKVDLFITYEDFTENNVTIKYNRDIAGEYMQYLKQMAEDFHWTTISVFPPFPDSRRFSPWRSRPLMRKASGRRWKRR